MSEAITVLVCGGCGKGLGGLSTDSAFLCPECGRGWGIGPGGLFELPVSIRTSGDSPALPLPFWLVEADVAVNSRLTRRETHNVGVQRGRWFAPALETGLRETGGFEGRRTLVIPAFSLNGLFDLGVRLSGAVEDFPEEIQGPWPRLAGVFSRPEEIRALAGGVCVGQEAAPDDWLADVSLEVRVVSSALLVLPGEVGEETVTVAGTGASFYRRNMPDLERILEFHRGRPG